jgi:hypothetical protein
VKLELQGPSLAFRDQNMRLAVLWKKVEAKKGDRPVHSRGYKSDDPLSITFPDPDHTIGESRYVIIGRSRSR